MNPLTSTSFKISDLPANIEINYSYNTTRTGFLGSIELISYLIMFSLFGLIFITNKSKLKDVPAGTTAGAGKVVDYSNVLNWVSGIGILLCLIRIVWANSFYNKKRSSRALELLFSLLVWGLFITALVFSLKNKSQLAAVVPNGTVTQSLVTDAQNENKVEYISCAIGIGLSSLYTIYNMYYLSQK